MSRTKTQTNVEFVTNMMDFSKYGALAQLFVLHAIEQTAKIVSEVDPETIDNNALISGHAWVGVAKEIKRKIEERKL